jgi:hypothetical protein
MKNSALLLSLATLGVAAATAATAQESKLDASLVQAARTFEKSMNRRDFSSVATSTNRKVVATLGGETAVAEAIRSSIQHLSYGRMHFQLEGSECSPVPPNIVCVIPYTVAIVVNGETYVHESFYLASAEPNAEWFFADGNGASKPGAMEFLFPGYSGAPKLPAKVAPRKAVNQP